MDAVHTPEETLHNPEDAVRTPYEGAEPYIFISYARKDAERVYPLLDALCAAGYRIWYDKGIQAGAHWTETLVEQVENCGVFCPLFSDAFNQSRFCFEETEYAYRNDKPIVPVYLEKLDAQSLRPLFRLLGSRQDLRAYQYPDAVAFAARMEQEEAFAPCRAPQWNKIGQIQWKLDASGVLTIAMNEDWLIDGLSKDDLSFLNFKGSIPGYQYDRLNKGSTAPWMSQREKITSVVIENDINSIGDRAFCGCTSLTAVTIPDSVKKIGDSAFSFCASLTAVTIPDSVTEIGDRAFRGCTSLSAATIPDSVEEISGGAFEYCDSLTAVTIPDSVTEIGDYAFSVCASLTAVTIPDSVTEIGEWAFSYCASLTAVTIPDSVTEIGYRAFGGCTSLKRVEIPAGADVPPEAFDKRYTEVIRRKAPSGDADRRKNR